MAAHRFAFALIAVVALLLFAGPLVRGEVPMLRDHAGYFQPLRWFTAMELSAGRLPLWNPYNQSGEPWLANPQTGVFYPPQWLFLLLPFSTAYVLYLLLHVALLGWGAYLLFERVVSREAALVGAVALMLSGPVLSLVDVSNNLATFSWIPLALWCGVVRRPIVAGLVLALAFLGGEPFFAALGAVMYAAVVLIVARRAAIPRIAASALVAIGIAAIQLFPFLEMVAPSERLSGAVTAREILHHSMPLRDWPRIAVPPRLDDTVYDARLGQHFIPVIYVGIVPAALAAIGIITGRRRRAVYAALALLAFAIVVAAGPQLLAALPLTMFRYPARLVPFGALAIALLAAIGWERIRRWPRWADLLLVLAIVIDLTIQTAPLFQSATFRTEVVPHHAGVGADAKVLRIGTPANRAGGWWMIGYTNLYERRWDAFTPAPVVDARYYAAYRELLREPRARFLSFLPVRHVISDQNIPLPRVASGPGVALYQMPQALPLASFWTSARAASSPDDALRALIEGKSGATLLVTPSVDAALSDAEPRIEPVAFEISTSHARMRVEAARPGIVVLSQRDARGWRVTVDGKPSANLLANGIFRAVAVPAGVHEVVWTYRPPSLIAGAATTLLALLVLLLRAVVKRRAMRKSSGVSLVSE